MLSEKTQENSFWVGKSKLYAIFLLQTKDNTEIFLFTTNCGQLGQIRPFFLHSATFLAKKFFRPFGFKLDHFEENGRIRPGLVTMTT